MGASVKGYKNMILNKGLPTNFKLVNGAFGLTGGAIKGDDNMIMFLNFFDWFRVFTNDFCVKIQSIHARSISSFDRYKSLFKLEVLDTGDRYLEFVNIDKADLRKDIEKRAVGVEVAFSYNIPTTETTKTITFEQSV